MHKNISLVVPEVNEKVLKNYKKTNIIANPNCSTAQLVVALKPLHDKFKIKRVVVSTYQAVSGAGKEPMDELFSQTKNFLNGKKIKSKFFTKQIAFNLIPHVDDFIKGGSTSSIFIGTSLAVGGPVWLGLVAAFVITIYASKFLDKKIDTKLLTKYFYSNFKKLKVAK